MRLILKGKDRYLRSFDQIFSLMRWLCLQLSRAKRWIAVAIAAWKGGYSPGLQVHASKLWAVESLEPRLLLSIAPGLVPIGSRPEGSLSGKIVYTSAGHGWQWNSNLNRWATDRPNLLSMVEDFGNQDQLTYYADTLLRAGATVVPMRPVGRQLNEVIVDNDSPNVTWSGSWSDNTAGPRWYDEDYGATTDAVKYRFSTVNSQNETAVATYTPNIPQAGHYPVYVWAAFGSNRTNQLYKVNHTGGQTQIRVDHRNVGNGWVYLGTYFFDQGQSSEQGSVQISNFSPHGGSVIIADAIRFGNGMGDLPWGPSGIGTGNISGYPREDEGSIVWLWRGLGLSSTFSSPSSVLGTSNVSAPLRMADHMNASANPYGMSVYIGFHSNATTGNPDTATARGALGLVHSNSPTPNQMALAVATGRQINVDMRALDGNYEHTWSNRTVYHFTGVYGEISNSVADGKFDATIVEVAFHDNTLDAQLMRDPRVRDQLARSTYEATLEHLHTFPGATPQPANITLPSAPILHRVNSNQSGEVTLQWNAGPSSSGGFNGVHGSPATRFRVYGSIDGYGFDGGTLIDDANAQTVTLDGYDPDVPYYFKVVAENAGGQSHASEVLTVLPNGGTRSVLVVNGFDRLDRNQNFKHSYAFGGGGITERVWARFNNSRDFTVQVHQAINAARPGLKVDSASNEAVASGIVDLNNYSSVIWISGSESVVDQTFSAAEQTLLTNFISAGGNVFVSGSEIGYDLDSQNNGRSFYRNTLGATYVADSAGTHQVVAAGAGIFASLPALSFSNGAAYSSLVDQMYNVSSADVLTASSGSVPALQYQGGSGGTSGIQRQGQGSSGKTVVLGFPFEAIVGAENRVAVMEKVLEFFGHNPVEDSSVVVGSYVYHADSAFASLGIEHALDTSKVLAKEGIAPQTLDLSNLISSSRGINGIVFDIEKLPGPLSESDFVFQASPSGVFDPVSTPPLSWSLAPSPSSLDVSGDSPSRVIIQWPDNSIANQWLRITIKANANTGLIEPEVYYIGHLLGEVTGEEDGIFVVTFADIAAIRNVVGSTVGIGSPYDIDKDGLVSFADILAVRGNIASIVTGITISASGGGGGGSGGGGGNGIWMMAGPPPGTDLRGQGSSAMDRLFNANSNIGFGQRADGFSVQPPWNSPQLRPVEFVFVSDSPAMAKRALLGDASGLPWTSADASHERAILELGEHGLTDALPVDELASSTMANSPFSQIEFAKKN